MIISYSVFQYINWEKLILKSKNLVKSNGKILFIETLKGNPFAKIYRLVHKAFNFSYKKFLVPKEYLTFKELGLFDEHFKVQFFFYHFLTPLVLFKAAFQKAAGKKLYIKSEMFYNIINKIDKILISHISSLRRFSWFILIYGGKKN